MPAQGKPFEVFCSYDPRDEVLCLELEKHLNPLQRQGLLALWHHRKIIPGTNWAESIDTHLNQAALILLLISPDFLNSDYCYGVEMTRALQRHESNDARVIPVLLRPSMWKHAPFAHLTPLPANARPMSRWRDRNAAFVEIAEGIERAIQELHSFSVSTPAGRQTRLWNIPFPRNRFFLGRDELLMELRRRLRPEKPLAISQPQAISGLGGIGKTQLVLEYAYRFADDYQAVLWVRAESRETVTSGFLELARILQLPEQEKHDPAVVIQAVKGWLSQQERWLLVLDNADELSFLPEFLPVPSSGHIVLTTRAQAVNQLASRLEVDVLEEEAGVLLLLRRAGTLGLDASLEQVDDASYLLALRLCQELGWLPLALDQAGAYIEETQCGLQGYLDLFHQRRDALLRQRGGIVQDHEAVAATWSLSFAAVEQKNAVAADLLRLCAVLHPDAIPEEMVLRGASALGEQLGVIESDPLALNRAFAVLTSYSLIRRTSREQTLSMHRLVQAVLQDAMGKQDCDTWVQRAIRALDMLFPESDHTVWNQCERLLPHALTCIEESTTPLENNLSLASLSFTVAGYLYERTRYTEAEALYQRALRIWEAAWGPEHPQVASLLNNLAILYRTQGKYAEAEPLYQQALRIREAVLGPEHPDVASPLNGLAILYKEQGKHAEAEPLYQQALRIREAALGPEHPQVASLLNNLAILYRTQGKYAEAETLYQRVLRILEAALGPGHPDVAYPLNNLAVLYYNQGKYAEAEPLYQRAIRIREVALGAEHPLTAKVRVSYDRFLQHWKEAEDETVAGNKKRNVKKQKG